MIEEIGSDINHFDKHKFPCSICGQKGHNFNSCPQLKNTDMEKAYIRLLLLVNRFMQGLKKLDPRFWNHDLQSVQSLTLSELGAIEHVSISSSFIFLPFLRQTRIAS